MRKKLLTALLTSVFILGGATQTFANATNIEKQGTFDEIYNEMYAVETSKDLKVNSQVNDKTLNSSVKSDRTSLKGALGQVESGSFYSVGSHDFSKYAFDEKFYNTSERGIGDIEFHEVTWGSSWHEEAVEIYLVNPVIRNCKGEEVEYKTNDITNAVSNESINISDESKKMLEGDNLYFAGVTYNKRVEENGTVEKYKEYEKARFKEITGSWYSGERDFEGNYTEIKRSNFDTLITEFNLPEEVVSAEGIVLVDITSKINSNNQSLANDDGFDLAGIKVWGKK